MPTEIKSWRSHYESAVRLSDIATEDDVTSVERPVMVQLALVEAVLALVVGLGDVTAGFNQ